jgi:hypothetical protein
MQGVIVTRKIENLILADESILSRLVTKLYSFQGVGCALCQMFSEIDKTCCRSPKLPKYDRLY